MPVDPNLSHCPQCGAEFGFFKRRHWCRTCGSTICSGCSVAFNDSVAAFFLKRHPDNVCKACHAKNASPVRPSSAPVAVKTNSNNQQQQKLPPPVAKNNNNKNQGNNSNNDDLSSQILGTNNVSSPVSYVNPQHNQRRTGSGLGGNSLSGPRSFSTGNSNNNNNRNTTSSGFPTSLLPPSSRPVQIGGHSQNNNNNHNMFLGGNNQSIGNNNNSLRHLPGARSPNPFMSSRAAGGLQIARLGGNNNNNSNNQNDGGNSFSIRQSLTATSTGANPHFSGTNNVNHSSGVPMVANANAAAAVGSSGGLSLSRQAPGNFAGSASLGGGGQQRKPVLMSSGGASVTTAPTTNLTVDDSGVKIPTWGNTNNNNNTYTEDNYNSGASAGSLPSNFFAKLAGRYQALDGAGAVNIKTTPATSPSSQQHPTSPTWLTRQSNLSLLQQYILDSHEQITTATLSAAANQHSHHNKSSSSTSSDQDQKDLARTLTANLASVDNLQLNLHFKGTFRRDHFRACVQVALDRHRAFHSRLELTDIASTMSSSSSSSTERGTASPSLKPKIQRLTVAPHGVPLNYSFKSCTKEEVNKLMKTALTQPFNLSRDLSLFRAHIFEVFENEEEKNKSRESNIRSKNHICVFVAHRLVCDSKSLNLFFDDVRALYKHASELIIPTNTSFSNNNNKNSNNIELTIDDNVVQKILPPLFADSFVNSLSWDRDLLDTNEGQELRHRMMSALPECCQSVIEIPTDHSRGARYAFETEMFELPKNLLSEDDVAKLRSSFSSQSSSLSHGVLAAFTAVLLRYSGQEEVSVAVRQDMRPFCSANDAIGPFTNFQMFSPETKYSPLKTSFSELLASARSFSNDIENRCVPFPALLEKSLPSPGGHFPLAQISFVSYLSGNISSSAQQQQLVPIALGCCGSMTASDSDDECTSPLSPSSSSSVSFPEMGDVQIRPVPHHQVHRSSMFDLTLHVWEDSQSHLRIALQYNKDLFIKSTIADFSDNFATFLRDLAHKGISNSVSSYELLSEQQKKKLLYDVNKTDLPISREIKAKNRGVPYYFEESAAKHPNRLAITMPEGRDGAPETLEQLQKASRPIIHCRPSMTYSELDKLSNQFARFLRSRFLEPAARMANINNNNNTSPAVSPSVQQQQQLSATSAPVTPLPLMPLTSIMTMNSPQTSSTVNPSEQQQHQDVNSIIFNKQQSDSPFIIAVCMPRCTLQFATVLAILKAGAGYLPLDLSYPADRLDFMLGDSGALCVVTSRDVADSPFGQLFSTIGTPAVIAEEVTGSIDMLKKQLMSGNGGGEENKKKEFNSLPPLNSINMGRGDSCAEVLDYSTEPLHVELTPKHLSYIIYTSGSTGKPKAVMQNHGSNCNMIAWENDYFPPRPELGQAENGVRALQFAPISFDISFEEVFCTWGVAGSLFVVSEDLRLDPLRLIRLLNKEQVHRIFLPSIALSNISDMFVETGELPTSVTDVIAVAEQLIVSRTVVAFFEALRKTHQEKNKISKEVVTLRDHYGPTETHHSCFSVWTGEPSKWPASPPIGRPVANCQLYILDDARQLVPQGVTGELWTSGEVLGTGYLNRKEVTDACYVPCELPGATNTRMYKSGDLVRMLPDGQILWIRRKDFQVKVRGFRIELGEIEAQLSRHDLVQKCCCEVRSKTNPEGGEDKHIVGYVILAPEKADEATVETKVLLQDHLRLNLPSYMVPTVFMFMNMFSITPSGKVNRKALPTPTALEFTNEVGGPAHRASSLQNNSDGSTKNTIVEPQTKTETAVRAIWSDVLGNPIPSISCSISFFQIGGHSLTVAKMLSRANSQFHCDIPVSFAFQHPTVTEIAEEIDRLKKQGRAISASPTSQLEEFFSMGESALNQLEDKKLDKIVHSAASLGGNSNHTNDNNDDANSVDGGMTMLPPYEYRYPLTLNQQSLVYLSTVHPDSAAAYNIIMCGELRNAEYLSIEDLENAFERVLDKFPALRTTFHQDPDSGEFFQTIHSKQELDFNVIDIEDGNAHNEMMMGMYAGAQSFAPGGGSANHNLMNDDKNNRNTNNGKLKSPQNNNNNNNNTKKQQLPPPQFGEALASDNAIERMRVEAVRPFDLSKDSMMRVRLFRAAASSTSSTPTFYLQLVFHHIVTDLWSIVLITEALQEAFATKKISSNISNASSTSPSRPSTQVATMVDFARYLQLRERQAAPRMLEQWKTLLRVKERPLPSLDLPTDYPRPTVKTHNGGVRSFSFSSELSEDLRNFAKSGGNTMYSSLLSIVSIVLHKLTRQEEIIVGTPLANRHVQDFEETCGYFVNPCPIPVDVTGDTIVTELLQRALNTVHNVMDLQEYPFPQLADRLVNNHNNSSSSANNSNNNNRNASDIFQVMFIYQQPHRLEELNPFFLFQDACPLTLNADTGLTMYSVSVPTHIAMYDLVIQFGEGPGGRVCGCIEYNSDLFHPVMIDSIISIVEVITEQILSKPSARVDELRTTSQQAGEWMVSEMNRHPQHSLVRNGQMMLSFGDVYIDLLHPKQTSFVWLFRKIAARYSDRIAIDFTLAGQERKLTFQELDQLSDALAALIIEAHRKYRASNPNYLLFGAAVGSSSNIGTGTPTSLPISPARTALNMSSNSNLHNNNNTGSQQTNSTPRFPSSAPTSNLLLHQDPALLQGAFVGVALRRGPLIVVAELAVMKAGGAFIPIDPSYPEDRVRHMLSDSGSGLMICTSEDSKTKFSAFEDQIEKLVIDNLESITSPAVVESVFGSSAASIKSPAVVESVFGSNAAAAAEKKQHCDSIIATSHEHLSGDDRCYAIYTSGSTGKPKGVVLGHRGLVNLSYSIRIGYRMFVEQTRFLWFASPSFDASILEIFPILANASTVVILSPDPIVGDSLARLMDSGRISHAVLPPAVLAGIAEDCFPPPSLKILVTAGEAIPGELLTRWRKKVYMLNAYGPTENTVASTICDYDALRVFVADRAQNLPQIIQQASQQDGVIVKAPPIGRTIPNTRCYILDRNLHPCAIGIPGELVVSGPGVAHGYHNLPQKTEDCFLVNPFENNNSQNAPMMMNNSSNSNSRQQSPNNNNNNNNSSSSLFGRMYKTGDLVRWSPAFHTSGVIEFSGRIDQQVKIRGYRIELGEVESAIMSLPGVAECAVAAKDIVGSGKSLVAYIVVASSNSSSSENSNNNNTCLSQSEMKKRLRSSLPEYMVPMIFVTLTKLPLSPSGKIDRNQLPVPTSSSSDDHHEQNNNNNNSGNNNGKSSTDGSDLPGKELPHTPLQITIATLFSEVLGASYKSTIGLHDNFFEIGGHSLAAMQLVSRLKEHTGLDIPILKIFEAPTVGALSDVVRSAAGDATIPEISLNRKENEEIIEDGVDEDEPDVSTAKRSFMLSYNQEALWFSYLQDQNSSAFNSTFTAKISDPSKVNTGALVLAVACCKALHPMLRSKFSSHDGTGVSQIISKNCFPFLTQRSWTDKQKKNANNEQRTQLEHDAASSIDLERRSFMMYTYTNEQMSHDKIPSPQEQIDRKKHFTISLAPITHFIINFHHIVMDLGSMELVIEQLVKFYRLIVSILNSNNNDDKKEQQQQKQQQSDEEKQTIRSTIQKLLSSNKNGLAEIMLPENFPSFVRNKIVRNLLSSSSSSSLEVPPVSYIDFAEWQREVLRSSVGEQLSAYWQRHLLSAPAETSFKLDKPRQNPRNLDGGTIVPKISPNFSQMVSDAARSLGTTNATVLLASTFAWMHRITGQNDLIIGTPVAGRTRSELESVVGDFVNILPLRVEVPSSSKSSQTSFRQVLRSTKTSLLKGLMHQEYPFGLMVENFCEYRDATKNPLFQVMFVHEKPTHTNAALASFAVGEGGGKFSLSSPDGENGGGVNLESVEFFEHQCQFDVVISVSEGQGGQLSMRMQYAASLFNPETAANLAQQWIAVTSAALTAPSSPVHEISLLTPEQLQVLEERNRRTTREYDALKQGLTAHEVVERTSVKYPANVAVFDPLTNVSLNYKQLNAVSNSLAKKLRSLALEKLIEARKKAEKMQQQPREDTSSSSVTKDLFVYEPPAIDSSAASSSQSNKKQPSGHHHQFTPSRGDLIAAPVTVAFLFVRSVSTIVSMLASSKSGVSYVPIDTKAPIDRIKYIIKDSGAIAVLYHDQSKELLKLLNLDDKSEAAGNVGICVEETVNVDEFIDQSSSSTGDNNEKRILQSQEENLSNTLVVGGDNNNEQSSSSPPMKIRQQSPLYMIYTSGSTGNPKGVAVHHGGLVSVASWFVEEHKLRNHDVYAQALGAAFDPVNIEVWPSLFAGAKILILDDDTKLSDPQTIVDYLHKHRVTHLTFPPVLSVKILKDATFPKGFAMKSWSCGGEKFSGTKRPLTFSLINAYGPTEASILCAQYPLNFDVPEKALDEPQPPEASRASVDPPLGDPTANTSHYVLDDNDRLCPPGMVGELVVGGAQIAIGYHNNPNTTDKSFVRDTFASATTTSSTSNNNNNNSNASTTTTTAAALQQPFSTSFALRDAEGYPRMYRTGDLVRYDGDFNLHFVGRKDFQVKIRGFRIEMGEIETQLLLLSDLVSATQVIAYEGPKTNGEKRLFAFIIPHTKDHAKLFGSSGSSGDENSKECKQERAQLRKCLSRALKSRLPDYMIPVFVLAPKFILTPNGKVDRQKLEVPDADGEEYTSAADVSGDSVTEPRNEVEKVLCDLWCDILGVKVVSPLDNWYSRGGSSLTSTVLISRVKQLFDIIITLQQFFVEPTVEGLAKVIASNGKSTVVDNFAEVLLRDSTALDESITAKQQQLIPFDPNQEPSGIFVTGATGFLGAFLTFELLRETSATIYCLVRAKTESEGLKRILDTFVKYKINSEVTSYEFESRIIPVIGDLARPYFDLSQQRFDELASLCQAIIHCGAFVNFGYPYSSLKNANVDGTVTALRLATTTQLKAFHHISTLSCLPDKDEGKNFVSERRLPKEPSKNLHGGYTQSKWVAEQLAWLAFDRGVPVTVHRPGRITGHSITGATNNDDFLNLFVKGCLEMKSAPLIDMPCELTPVDFCARSIIRCSIRHPTSALEGHCLHITNESAMSWEKYFGLMREVAGYPEDSVKMVPFKIWREDHLLKLTGESHNALLPLVPTFAADFEKEFEHVEYKTENLMKDLNSQGTLENLVRSAQMYLMTSNATLDELRVAFPCRTSCAELILSSATEKHKKVTAGGGGGGGGLGTKKMMISNTSSNSVEQMASSSSEADYDIHLNPLRLQTKYPETTETLVRVYAQYFIEEKFFPERTNN